jgi:hypothetical protein
VPTRRTTVGSVDSGKGRVAGNEGEGAEGVGSLRGEEKVVTTGEVPG